MTQPATATEAPPAPSDPSGTPEDPVTPPSVSETPPEAGETPPAPSTPDPAQSGDSQPPDPDPAAAQLVAFQSALAEGLDLDPARVEAQAILDRFKEVDTRAATAETQLAIYKAAPRGVDVEALLDSASFQASLASLAGDQAKIAAAVNQFVAAHPRVRLNPGAGDVAQGNGTPSPPPKTMDDWIRGNN